MLRLTQAVALGPACGQLRCLGSAAGQGVVDEMITYARQNFKVSCHHYRSVGPVIGAACPTPVVGRAGGARSSVGHCQVGPVLHERGA